MTKRDEGRFDGNVLYCDVLIMNSGKRTSVCHSKIGVTLLSNALNALIAMILIQEFRARQELIQGQDCKRKIAIFEPLW